MELIKKYIERLDIICEVCGGRKAYESLSEESKNVPDEDIDEAIYIAECCEGYETVSVTANTIVLELVETQDDYVVCCSECPDGTSTSDSVEPVDNLFHSMVLSHGVATGYGNNTSLFNAQSNIEWVLDNLNSDAEICCSNKKQCLGPVGIYIQGFNRVVSNMDIYSYVNENGIREWENSVRSSNGLISRIEEYFPDVWEEHLRQHAEHIVCPRKIRGLWIKDWAVKDSSYDEIHNYMESLSAQLGIKLYVIKEKKE